MGTRETGAKALTDLLCSTRPTQVVVDLDAIVHNYRALCAHCAPVPVMPVIKANAYGHGLVEVARALLPCTPPCFGVATFEEALALRSAGIDTDLLVFGGLDRAQIPWFITHRIGLTASSVAKLAEIDAAAERAGIQAEVHLKIDTGMERVGVHHYNADTLLDAAAGLSRTTVRGLYSHFATADDFDHPAFEQQRLRVEQVAAKARARFGEGLIVHAANSAALLRDRRTHHDMVRAGIALYGVLPGAQFPSPLELRPALSWHSRVVYFKVVRAGDAISYGARWRPTRDTRVVTVPVGYADGYSRRLSGAAEVAINGHRYPVVGTICMDQLMVDIGQDSAFNGDAVELLGPSIDAHELAERAGTIAYEVLTTIGARVPRLYHSTSGKAAAATAEESVSA